MTPKISIIVPAYNEEKYIARCLDSILKQTFTDFEVICVDDGSTDNTFNILTEYSKKDSRIIPLKNTGKGVSSARNYGIENSNGEYIGFVDSDDFIQPQMYEYLYKAIKENNSDFVFTGSETINYVYEDIFSYNLSKKSLSELLYSNYNLPPICIWTKLIKKEYLVKKRIKFENYKVGEDVLFCSKLFANTINYCYIDLPLYINFIKRNSVINSLSIHDEKFIDQIETFLLSYDVLKDYKDKKSSCWFLENGMKLLLSFNNFNKNKKLIKIKNLYRNYSKKYFRCKEISLANKIYVFISYHFPLLYEARRKMLDKTIR